MTSPRADILRFRRSLDETCFAFAGTSVVVAFVDLGEAFLKQRQQKSRENPSAQGRNNSANATAMAHRAYGIDFVDRALQGARASGGLARSGTSSPALQAEQTGKPLAPALKAGLEGLSGIDLSEVRVHEDSAQPALINALAFAQGNAIHLAPGQARHLPHEAWHVVQQRQGRVQQTTQALGIAMNDSEALEREADVMGRMAMSTGLPVSRSVQAPRARPALPPDAAPIQRMAIARGTIPGLTVDLDTTNLPDFTAKLAVIKAKQNRALLQKIETVIGKSGNEEDAPAYHLVTQMAAEVAAHRKDMDAQLAELANPTSSMYMRYLSLVHGGDNTLPNQQHQEAVDDWVAGAWSLVNNYLHGSLHGAAAQEAESLQFNNRPVGNLQTRADTVTATIAQLPAFEPEVYRYFTPKPGTDYDTVIAAGDYVEDTGFSATSFIKKPDRWGLPGKVYCKIQKGHSGKAIYPYSAIKTEWEVLIDKGGLFRVDGLKKIHPQATERPTYYMILTQVGLDEIPSQTDIKDYWSGSTVRSTP